MANNGTPFPFAALSVVALFVSTALLGQQAFELWRPADTQARKQLTLPDPPVEARLWEDPLAAAARFREQAREICAAAGSGAKQCEDAYRVPVKTLQRRLADWLSVEPDRSEGALTIIAAMIPGGRLVGTDEARRRTRHAILAGLNTQGYMPDDSDRMGLLRTTTCDWIDGCGADIVGEPIRRQTLEGRDAPEPIDIVYEALHTRAAPAHQRRALVLWIDDTKYRTRWLSALTVLLGDLAPDKARLVVVGPYSSDSLAKALRVDAAGWSRGTGLSTSPEGVRTVERSLGVLSRLHILSPFASAPFTDDDLVGEMASYSSADRLACETDCAGIALRHYFESATKRVGLTLAAPQLVRTVAPDTALVAPLVRELANRGVPVCDKGRLVLISEWDSVYARRFGQELRDALDESKPLVKDEATGKLMHDCPSGRELTPVVYSYARGLDGATAERSAEQARVSAKSSGDDKDKKRPPEWPEGQAQEDYVHRLVDRIRRDDRADTVRAIGLIGYDIHDKLILAQALRDIFPDRILFTTDMDARLVHPTTTRWTRNMIVASSLPLEPDQVLARDGLDNNPRDAVRVGPFRDSYQTSTFLAARYAVHFDDPKTKLPCVARAIAQPVLFELGHRSALVLDTPARAQTDDQSFPSICPVDAASSDDGWARVIAALVAGTALLVLSGLVLFGFPGPAMAAVREALGQGAGSSGTVTGEAIGLDRFKVAVAMLEWAAIGFAAGVVVELGWPTQAGAWRPAILAAAFALAVPTLLQARFDGRFAVLCGGALIGLAVWACLRTSDATIDPQEPLDALSGTSAWPSLLIRTGMVVLVPWFLDRAWFTSAANGNRLTQKFFGYLPAEKTHGRPTGGLASWGARLRNATGWFWNPWMVLVRDDRINGAALWRAYHRMMGNRARFRRVIMWSVLGALVFTGVMEAMSYWVDRPMGLATPARGDTIRLLILQTQFVATAGLLLLLVIVGDETILTWRFVTFLEKGRTVYPQATVAQFASELGADLASVAATPVAAQPRQRAPLEAPLVPAQKKNSLLDDWIDARLLADQTEAVAPQIMYPFLLVGLAIIARSPIFDNWDMGPAILLMIGLYLLWSIAMAILLNMGAERARQKALRSMALDLIWLEGTAAMKPLVPTFGELIDRVRNLRRGAFAPFFERSWVQAVLVPLGGAGGVQLLQFLLYARSQ